MKIMFLGGVAQDPVKRVLLVLVPTQAGPGPSEDRESRWGLEFKQVPAVVEKEEKTSAVKRMLLTARILTQKALLLALGLALHRRKLGCWSL